MEHKRLIKLSATFVRVCIYWGSLSSELGMAVSRPLQAVDRLTLAWSAVIVATSFIKVLSFESTPKAIATQAPANSTVVVYPTLNDFILLNYLPKMAVLGQLYHGLLCILVTTALVRRVHLIFLRPTRSSLASQFNYRREVVRFFIAGPGADGAAGDEQASDTDVHMDELIERPEKHDEQATRVRQRFFLGRMHRPIKTQQRSSDRRSLTDELDAIYPVPETYRISVGVYDMLADNSAARWLALAKHVYTSLAVLMITSIPLWCLALIATIPIVRQLSLQPEQTGRGATALWLYSFFEQLYLCAASGTILLCTNMFVAVCHADFTYKANMINQELVEINKTFLFGLNHNLTRNLIRRQQLRVWALFDIIKQIDDYVAKYSLILFCSLLVSLVFGQGIFQLDDDAPKEGAAGAIGGTIVSFTYLCTISGHTETKISQIYTRIQSIVAQDDDYITKRLWHKMLVSLFSKDNKRTFSLDNKFALGFRFWITALVGMAGVSMLINRLKNHKA